ncbi:MAG: hypothetical protein ACRC3I_06780 [Cetobacterium sp.]
MKHRKKVAYENLNYAFQKFKNLEGITLSELKAVTRRCDKTLRRYIHQEIISSEFASNTHIIFVKSLLPGFIPPSKDNLPDAIKNLGFFPELNFFFNNTPYSIQLSFNEGKLPLKLIKTKNRTFVCLISSKSCIDRLLNPKNPMVKAILYN